MFTKNNCIKIIGGLFMATALLASSCKKDTTSSANTTNSKNGKNYTSFLRPGGRNPYDGGRPLGGCVKEENDAQYASLAPNNGLTPLGGNNEMYLFRDSFLSKTEKGIDYIYYYYDLSEYAIQNNLLTAQTFRQWYQLLKYGLQICNTIQNGQNTDTVITSEIYNFCKNQTLITTQSINYNQVSLTFQVLNTDLENLKGKTKSQFISYFQ
jgi:hypothetical protein